MGKLVQFGAGNIGRSFIGQLFSRAGWEVVFVDVDLELIAALNEKREYRVVIKHPDRLEEVWMIGPVRAVNGRDADAVAAELADADMAATAVGQRALQAVIGTLATGLPARPVDRPLDVIIAENLHGAADFFRRELKRHLPEGFPIDSRVGLIETSIGKMVPIMREEDLAVDPLQVFAEPYNRLILDRRGFLNPIPDVAGLAPMENMKAWVDRKLCLHNLGHAATAYFGFLAHPEATYIYEVLGDEAVREKVFAAMTEATRILNREYPEDLSIPDLERNRDDLLARFANVALGDTVFRVGRDLYRKLDRHDRLVGAMVLGAKHDLPFGHIASAWAAAIRFRGRDEQGMAAPGDERFEELEAGRPVEDILKDVSGLRREDPAESKVIDAVLAAEREYVV